MICIICQERYAPSLPEDFDPTKDNLASLIPEQRKNYFSNEEDGGCNPEHKIILLRMLSAYNSSIKRNQ